MDKLVFVGHYIKLLLTTLCAFILSILGQFGAVCAFYWLFLYFNPNGPDEQKFYNTTSVTKGVNVGGKTIGGGQIVSNHNKSFFWHLVKEYYANMGVMFFVEFCVVYLAILFWFNFFPQRATLNKELRILLNINNGVASDNGTNATNGQLSQSGPDESSSLVSNRQTLNAAAKRGGKAASLSELRRRVLGRAKSAPISRQQVADAQADVAADEIIHEEDEEDEEGDEGDADDVEVNEEETSKPTTTSNKSGKEKKAD